MPSASSPHPKVSIVIPVYNGSNYLREAIDSALAQTYDAVEVVVVNDGSRDGGATDAIARTYGDRIRYVAQENGGVSTALNTGIRTMSGEYFSWLSHDDRYRPEKISAQMARLAAGAPPTILYSDYAYIDGSGDRLRVQRVSTGGRPMRFALLEGAPIGGCTLLVPRVCFEAMGTFDPRLRTFQDLDMWFRLAKVYPFAHVPEVLVESRIHPGQVTRTKAAAMHRETTLEMIRLLGDIGADEIRAAGSGAPSTFYTRMALNVKLRGFDEVARAALDLSRRHAGDDGALERVARAAVVAACAVLTKKMKPSYWTSRVRRSLRRPPEP